VAAQNHWFPGSANIDLSEGSQATITNNLFVKGASAFSASGPYIFKWDVDHEELNRGADVYWLKMQNNIFINDGNPTQSLFGLLGPSYLLNINNQYSPYMNTSLSISKNNQFIGPNHGPGFNGYDYLPYDKLYTPGANGVPPNTKPIPDIPVSGDTYYDTRAAAGYGPTQLPVPSACTQPIGNVAIPMK
jgi:hypothetical protein